MNDDKTSPLDKLPRFVKNPGFWIGLFTSLATLIDALSRHGLDLATIGQVIAIMSGAQQAAAHALTDGGR